MSKGKIIVMDETVNHIFKHDASILENMMQRGYDRKVTVDGDVYISVNPDTPPSPLWDVTDLVQAFNFGSAHDCNAGGYSVKRAATLPRAGRAPPIGLPFSRHPPPPDRTFR